MIAQPRDLEGALFIGPEKRLKRREDPSGLSELSSNVDNHRLLTCLDDHEGPESFIEQKMREAMAMRANDIEKSRSTPTDREQILKYKFCGAMTCNVSPGGEHQIPYEPYGLGAIPVRTGHGKKNDLVAEIKSALTYSSKIESGRQKVHLLFRAKNCDGGDVVVDNLYMRCQCPSLLIDFYEKHLKLPPSHHHEPKDKELRYLSAGLIRS